MLERIGHLRRDWAGEGCGEDEEEQRDELAECGFHKYRASFKSRDSNKDSTRSD